MVSWVKPISFNFNFKTGCYFRPANITIIMNGDLLTQFYIYNIKMKVCVCVCVYVQRLPPDPHKPSTQNLAWAPHFTRARHLAKGRPQMLTPGVPPIVTPSEKPLRVKN